MLFLNRAYACALLCITLAACLPKVEVDLERSDLEFVATTGTTQYTDFNAVISSTARKTETENRAMVARMERVLNTHFPASQVDTSFSDGKFSMKINGKLPIVIATGDIDAPWGLSVLTLNKSRKIYQVRLQKGDHWLALSKDMATATGGGYVPDFLQLTMKLKGFSGTIYGGGFTIDGVALSGYGSLRRRGEETTLSFKGDHWTKAPAGFLFAGN